MAEGKKSFVAYADWKATFDELSDEDAGKLIKHVFAYVNDENPETDNVLIRAVFANIKTALKRDLTKWQESLEKKSEGGLLGNLKRWNIDLHDKVVAGEIELQEAVKIASHRKASHTDTNRLDTDGNRSHTIASVAVSVNDNVSVNVKEEKSIKKKPSVFTPPQIKEVELYFIEEGYIVEAAQKFFKYYSAGNWHDSKNRPIRNWKQKAQGVWFKDEHKSSLVTPQKKNEDGKIFVPAFNIYISPIERAAWQKNWIGRMVTSGVDLNDKNQLSSWLLSNERSPSDIGLMKDHLQTFKDYFNVEA
jgi:hypothetical protein